MYYRARVDSFGGTDGPSEKEKKDQIIDFSWGIRIPLRDGVSLSATLYKPKDDEPTPAIFTLTPYLADSYHDRAYYFSQRGYAFLLVD